MSLFANPVLIKELRSRMRGNRAMIMLTIYLSIIGIVTLLVYAAVVSSHIFGPLNNIESGKWVGKAIFVTVMFVALVQVCFITPALTAGSIAGEKECQSYDLLLITLLSPWQIVIGKLMAALAYALLLIVAVLPLAGLAFLFGGVSGIELLIGMVGLMVTAILYAAIGMVWSTVMRGTQGATALAIGTVIFWLLSVPFLWFVSSAILGQAGWMDTSDAMVVYTYIGGAMLYSHPFIALSSTQIMLALGQGPFVFTFNLGQGNVVTPAPWLAYTIIGLVLSLAMLFFSVRRLQPSEYNGGGRQRGSRTTTDQPALPGAQPTTHATQPVSDGEHLD